MKSVSLVSHCGTFVHHVAYHLDTWRFPLVKPAFLTFLMGFSRSLTLDRRKLHEVAKRVNSVSSKNNVSD